MLKNKYGRAKIPAFKREEHLLKVLPMIEWSSIAPNSRRMKEAFLAKGFTLMALLLNFFTFTNSSSGYSSLATWYSG